MPTLSTLLTQLAERGREQEEGKIRLEKGKVKGHTLAEPVADLVDILIVQVVLCAPLLNPLAVEGMVMQRKHRRNILPFSRLGCNSRAAFVAGVGDEEIGKSEALGFGHRLVFKVLGDVLVGGGDADAVEPVLDSVAIDLVSQETVGGDLDED